METLPGHLDRLPAGQDRRRAEMLTRSQRDRILTAMADLVAKRGYQGTTVELIVKRAGVARVTFYENFENREACLLACFDEVVAEIRADVVGAALEEDDWPRQLRVGLQAFLAYVVANPSLARTCIVESMAAGNAALERYEEALRTATPFFLRGRQYARDGDQLPDTLEDSLVGGIIWMVHQRFLRNEIEAISGLLPTMLEFVLGPYLGENRAAELAAEV